MHGTSHTQAVLGQTKAALESSKTVVGSWINIPSPFTTQIMAQSGAFDFLLVDLEHGPITFETAAQLVSIIALAGVSPIVRVPSNTAENIKRALDLGPDGIMIPMINTPQDAMAAVSACRYPPQGIRSAGVWLAAMNTSTTSTEYYATANDKLTIIAQVESREAIANSAAIAAVDGIDVLLIGPNDLHCSLGLAPTSDSADPEFNRSLTDVLSVCSRAGKAPGLFTLVREVAERRIAQGFQFVSVGTDVLLLMEGIKGAALPGERLFRTA